MCSAKCLLEYATEPSNECLHLKDSLYLFNNKLTKDEVRRLMLGGIRYEVLGPAKRIYMSCGDAKCVNPAHYVLMTKLERKCYLAKERAPKLKRRREMLRQRKADQIHPCVWSRFSRFCKEEVSWVRTPDGFCSDRCRLMYKVLSESRQGLAPDMIIMATSFKSIARNNIRWIEQALKLLKDNIQNLKD